MGGDTMQMISDDSDDQQNGNGYGSDSSSEIAAISDYEEDASYVIERVENKIKFFTR
jgi:hypothetical protein